MKILSNIAICLCGLISLFLSACSTFSPTPGINRSSPEYTRRESDAPSAPTGNYASRLPSQISSTSKTVLIDPNVHAWGAYNNGKLLNAGLAVAGADWCPDIGRRCHTSSGTFRVSSLGSAGCKSSLYPKPRGGAPMPYCMFFNGNQAMHGSSPSHLAEANLSHGCVRLRVSDAEWLRFNFVNVGTKVIVRPY